MPKASGLVICFAGCCSCSIDRQAQREEAGGIAGVFQSAVLLTGKLHSGQLQGAIEPGWALQLAGFGEALLEVDMGEFGQETADGMCVPFLEELFAVVVAPADPGLEVALMVADPTFELVPDHWEGCSAVDVCLADVGQLAAERGQLRAAAWADQALEVIHFTPFAGHQAGADFYDFHVCDGPATVVGGGFQIDHQPVGHTWLPCKIR